MGGVGWKPVLSPEWVRRPEEGPSEAMSGMLESRGSPASWELVNGMMITTLPAVPNTYIWSMSTRVRVRQSTLLQRLLIAAVTGTIIGQCSEGGSGRKDHYTVRDRFWER
jgi:hypothetical protein